MDQKGFKVMWLPVLALAAAGLLLAGCGKSLSETEVSYAGPAVDNLLEAIARKDYGQFSRDFSERMKAGIPEAGFEELAGRVEAGLGQYRGKSFLSAVPAKSPAMDLMLVKYRLSYASDSEVTLTVYFNLAGGKQVIEGLKLDSPVLAKSATEEAGQ